MPARIDPPAPDCGPPLRAPAATGASLALERLAVRTRELSAAEDFFQHFGVPFAPAVLHRCRLHVLKRFHQYLHACPPPAGDEAALHAHAHALLARAYADFVDSTPQEEKVFAVFSAGAEQRVSLSTVRATLPSHNQRS